MMSTIFRISGKSVEKWNDVFSYRLKYDLKNFVGFSHFKFFAKNSIER